MQRRTILTGLLAAGLARPSWAEVGAPTLLAAGQTDGGAVLHGLDDTGSSRFAVPLPARGHAAAAHPHLALAVAFARRPGTFALVIDCGNGAVRHRLTPPDGRQFNGHGAFVADGALLLTSEVVAETSEGRIGLWAVPGFRRIGEWPSGGIGPHDLRVLPDGRIAVANGGIRTDPADRAKLNLDAMQPSLALFSPDGTPGDTMHLPDDLRQNSIRHLAVTGNGLAFAMQWEGDPADPVPLLGLWAPGRAPVLCPAPPADMFAMAGYAGSIAATADRIAITSPRGGVVMVFDMAGGHIATHRRADVCGVARSGDGFVVSDGGGAMFRADDHGLTLLATGGPRWDNHLVRIV